jgi:hypothetical protein
MSALTPGLVAALQRNVACTTMVRPWFLMKIGVHQGAATFDAYLHKPYNPVDSRNPPPAPQLFKPCAKKKKCCA